MSRKITLSIFFLFTIVLSIGFAQNHKEKVKPAQKSVLILKDSSKLEIDVCRMMKDTLTKLGYKVKVGAIDDVNKEKASLYNLSIIFSAINAGNEVDPGVRKFMTAKTDSLSKVLLYTVYGNVYKDKDVDATTEATQSLHPKLIADQILRSLIK